MKISPSTKLNKTLAFNIVNLVLGLSFILGSCLLIWRNMDRFPLAVPFWFSKPEGEAWLASPNFLWLIPVVGSLLLIINVLAAYYFWYRERILSFLLIAAVPIVIGLLFYTLLEIILVVI